MTARRWLDLLAVLVMLAIVVTGIVLVALAAFGQEPEPDLTPVETSILAPDGTEIWCLDFGEWGTCDLVGYRW